MDKYYFRTEKLSVGYDGNPIVENIEISLPKGEILTLIGPNGAGKSTVLKSIAGQLKLISGTVFLDKDAMSTMKREEIAKRMSVVLTERIKAEMMTCEDVVATGRYPYTGKFGLLSYEDKRIIKEAMELVHVSEICDEEFNKISDGQKQRVMLARAICQEPEIVILDEPTSYLDIRYKLEFLSVLQKLKEKNGLTVIMSLHELELAERVSDRILCVNRDKTEKYGTPREIFQRGYIKELFGITVGSYDEVNGNMELAVPDGKAKTFVIAGCGNGRNIYRKLQRQGEPFITGIIFENDLDFPVAKVLAKELISAKAFEPIGNEKLEYAKNILKSCDKVICCRKGFGSLELENAKLLDFAKELAKEIIQTEV